MLLKEAEQGIEHERYPAGCPAHPWPHDLLKNWDELTDVEKELYIRQADVYGAYLAYTDHEIGSIPAADASTSFGLRSAWMCGIGT
jgi:arylsulfatase A-like enzyme